MSNLLEKASLVMIPSGYKEDVVYSQIPLDGSGDLTLTRASNGTRINSAGLVEVCPWNLLQSSEDFTNAYWSKDPGVTIDSNVATAPNGTTTADRANYSSTSISFYRIETFSGTNTFSVYLKGEGANIGKEIELEINNSGGTINVTLTGDWVRYETNANNANAVAIKRRTSGQATSVLVWGAQLNIGSTAKPYFPTTDRLNVPRLTYQNGGGGCPSLLLEKQSTNLALYSEDFASGWTQANITVTANNTTSPDGTQNADKIEASGSGSVSHSVRQFISTTSGSVYALSLYAKKGTTDWIMIRHDNGGTLNYFNLNTGAKGTADASATITSVGNGWYRIVVYHTGTGSNGPEIYIATSDGGNEFTASGQNIYIWGAQYEASSYPTSYINTTSASATRVADACFKTGISSLIGQTEGTVLWDVSNVFQTSGDGARLFVYTDGNNFILISPYANTLRILIVSSGTAFDNFITISGTSLKIAVAYKANDYKFYVNGVSVGTPTATSVPAMNSIGIVNDSSGSAVSSQSETKQLLLFKTRLTNAELSALTTI